MKPERISGTYHRTVGKLLRAHYYPKRTARFLDGHIYSGHASSHLNVSGRRIHKLMRLRYTSIDNRLLTIQLY